MKLLELLKGSFVLLRVSLSISYNAVFIVVLVLGINFLCAEEGMILSIEGNIKTSHGFVWYKKFYTPEKKDQIPLLMIHGGPGVAHNSMLILQALAIQRPVIFYDQLGCGNSILQPGETVPYTVEYFVSEVFTILDALRVDKVHLFGHSWGGAVAAEFAIAHQNRLKSLTLASPLLSTPRWVIDCKKHLDAMPRDVQDTIQHNEKVGTTDSQEYQDACSTFYAQHLCRLPKWPSDLVASMSKFNVDMYTSMWGPSEFTVTGSLQNFDCIESLGCIIVPTLITCGRFDTATPETAAIAAAKMKQVRVVVFEKSAHVAYLEEPEAYQRELSAFLDLA